MDLLKIIKNFIIFTLTLILYAFANTLRFRYSHFVVVSVYNMNHDMEKLTTARGL